MQPFFSAVDHTSLKHEAVLRKLRKVDSGFAVGLLDKKMWKIGNAITASQAIRVYTRLAWPANPNPKP